MKYKLSLNCDRCGAEGASIDFASGVKTGNICTQLLALVVPKGWRRVSARRSSSFFMLCPGCQEYEEAFVEERRGAPCLG